MSGRDEIFASIRANRPQADRPLPEVPLFDENFSTSLLSDFKENLQRMGGVFLDPPISCDALGPVREKIANAKVVCSTVPEIAGNRDIAGVDAPQELADVDVTISVPLSLSPRRVPSCSATGSCTSTPSPISRST